MDTQIHMTTSELAIAAAIYAAIPRLSGASLERLAEAALDVRSPEIRAEILIAADGLQLRMPPQFNEELDKVLAVRDAALAAEAEAEAKRAERNGNISKGHTRGRAARAMAEQDKTEDRKEGNAAPANSPAPNVPQSAEKPSVMATPAAPDIRAPAAPTAPHGDRSAAPATAQTAQPLSSDSSRTAPAAPQGVKLPPTSRPSFTGGSPPSRPEGGGDDR